ncbi:MAG TPA: hypothetical protein VFC31_00580 [Candidatus Limnocylindria bacterium]|nr:hypothetical protein [Candidatus Limnocylindria bacterium]
MRGGALVVGMPAPIVVRRVAVVGEGVGVAIETLVVGRSGADAFRGCVAANAETPVKLETVTSVASPRSATDEVISGRDVFRCSVRPCMRLVQQAGVARA